jgi:WD40 repeat protein
MSCHPKKQVLLIASSNKEVSIWNLETKKCTYTLQCRENIVDLRFEANGTLIALTLQHTGCLYYQFKDFQLVLEAKLIESERATSWTSHCTINTSDTKKTIRTILGGENGNIYVWTSTSVGTKSSKGKVKQATLIGVIELPAQISMAVSIVKVDEEAGSFRLAIMCKEGDILILKVDNSGIATVGSWSIVCILPSSQLHGIYNAEISPFCVSDERVEKESRPGSGRMMTCNGKVLAVVGLDGTTRVFDVKTKVSKAMLKTLHARAANPVIHPAMKVVPKKLKKKSVKDYGISN